MKGRAHGAARSSLNPVSTSGVQNGTTITCTYYVVSEHYPTEYLCQSMWAEPQTRIVVSHLIQGACWWLHMPSILHTRYIAQEIQVQTGGSSDCLHQKIQAWTDIQEVWGLCWCDEQWTASLGLGIPHFDFMMGHDHGQPRPQSEPNNRWT